MHISNFRQGFACNSSSTHSIIVCKDRTYHDEDLEEGNFGWNYFIAASEEAKKSYLKTILYRVFEYLGDPFTKILANHFFEENIIVGDIDHQSFPLIPRKYRSDAISYEFFRELMDYVLRGDVVILGGNDNDCLFDEKEEQEILKRTPDWYKKLPKDCHHREQWLRLVQGCPDWYKKLPTDCHQKDWVCRKEGDWWILFNTQRGTKITLSFKDNPAPRTKAEVPELVDLKITNKCSYGCKFCYMNSTPDGKACLYPHDWLYVLNGLEVFEVALGGGEPTLHPIFEGLIFNNSCKDLKINFTTRNFEWIKKHKNLLQEKHTGFAYSVDSYDKAEEASKFFSKNSLNNATLQYVMTTASDEDFTKILQNKKNYFLSNLVLLGYKNKGRGVGFNSNCTIQKDPSLWIPLIKDANIYNVGVDTALAKEIPEDVFEEHLLRRSEGTHSMFIDAVESRAGKDSYSCETVPVGCNRESILNFFKTL
jgi:hypothetical protein